MKNRSKKNGSSNNDWETPDFIKKFVGNHYFKGYDFFDPCPLNADFDGLDISWGNRNFVNPPYSSKLKEAFIEKAFAQFAYQLNKSVLLLPANTDTKVFHNLANNENATITFVKGRIPFIGYKQNGEKNTKCRGQFGSMFVLIDVFNPNNNKLNTITLDCIKRVAERKPLSY